MRTGATLRIWGPDTSRVTGALGVEPTEADHSWRLVIPPTDDTELHVPLEALLAAIEPASKEVEVLRGEGYRLEFFCYLGSYATEHAAVLSPALLTRIADLGAEVWLDVYEEEPPELSA